MTSDDTGSESSSHGVTVGDSWNFVDTFISEIEGRIEGWLLKPDTLCFWLIDLLQKVSDIRGDLCKIGVYHGKSFLLLANFRRPDETIYGFDDFRNEKDLIVRELLESYAYSTERVELIAGVTQERETEELKATIIALLRLLHVDGGYSYSDCMHDLRTFGPLLGDGAVIAVDDYFDREYPGVSSALTEFCRLPEGAVFRPFLIGHNKLFMCRAPMVSVYQRGFIESDAFNFALGAHEMREGNVLIPFSRYPLPRDKLEELID
jgi:hypothetical protein